jgi:hypothetical protein
MEEIGFKFKPQSEKNERIWNAKLQLSRKYKRKHGNCLVPINNGEDVQLSKWVTHQRAGYKRGSIPSHRIQKLNEVGFVWSIVERGYQAPSENQKLSWEESIEKLHEFCGAHGHFMVPYYMSENEKANPLHSWFSCSEGPMHKVK